MKSSLLTCFLVGLVSCLLTGVLMGQDPIAAPEGIPVESDWLYRQHYEQVQEIMALPDVGEREKRLEAYYSKLDKKAKITQYMPAFFGQILKAYKDAGRTAEADALNAKISKWFPGAVDTDAQQFQTAYQKKDHAKIIQYGEKLYSKKADPQLAAALADSYIATKNAPKAVEYCTKVVDSLGPKQGVNYLYWLAEYYKGQQNLEKAGSYYSQLLRAYPSSSPQGWDSKTWGGVLASGHSVLASNAYVKQDYDTAIKHFSESLSYAPHNDHSYLFLGLSYWRKQELDLAMDAFAKATVLQKGNSAKAREYLEQLYKPRNNNSSEGLDDFLAQAKAALKL